MRRPMSVLAIVTAAAALAGFGADAAGGAEVPCATKRLYGHRLGVFLVDGDITCAAVRRIIRGPCRDGRTWSCMSFRTPYPVLVWYRTRERFAPSFSMAIEARRPPCSASRVTARAWRRGDGGGFPTRQQVLADDLLRCRQLEGMTKRQVTRLLGRPHERGAREMAWDVGPERDSVFQIDDEYFDVRFDRHDRFRAASFYQG